MSYADFSDAYGRVRSHKRRIILGLAALAVVVMLVRIGFGVYDISFIDSYRTMIDHILGTPSENKLDDYFIWTRNMPRAIACFIVGAGLGVCGAAMQSTLKNPLADPYMMGISSGANLGISVAVVCGFSILPFVDGESGHIANAFVFALIPAFIIVGISSLKKSVSPSIMILIGIAVMYVFSAASTMLNLMASPTQYVYIYSWALGTLGSIGWGDLPVLAVAVAFGLVALWLLQARLNLLSYSDRESVSLGLKPKQTRILVIVIISAVTATIVCFSGTIGFVGLVAPHIMRIVLGSDNRYLILASAVAGAFMLAAADTIAVEIIPSSLPVGVITSLIGGPLFILILIRQHKKLWYRSHDRTHT